MVGTQRCVKGSNVALEKVELEFTLTHKGVQLMRDQQNTG